jgi:hypothetical protein
MADSTNQDVIDAVNELREAIEALTDTVKTLNETAGDLFNAFDPKLGETRRELVEAMAALTAALRARPGEP